MDERETIFCPEGTIAFSLPIFNDYGRLVGAELVWLKPIWGVKSPWVGRSEQLPIDIIHELDLMPDRLIDKEVSHDRILEQATERPDQRFGSGLESRRSKSTPT